jgi:excinuclease ABC subunit C
VDGGKGQLSSAREALEQLNLGHLPLIGIAKRLEEIYRPGDPLSLLLSKKSTALQLLQHIRDEAHRFAIAYHRKKRSASALTGFLDNIPGLGKKSVEKLRTQFTTLSKLEQAGEEQLAALIGKKRAALLWQEIKKLPSRRGADHIK